MSWASLRRPSVAWMACVAVLAGCAETTETPMPEATPTAATPASTAGPDGRHPGPDMLMEPAGESMPQPRSSEDAVGRYGIGSPAGADLIAAWDIDVLPDGAGLPPGQGSVREGLAIYETKCLACHGPTGREGPFDLLAGRVADDAFPFATDRSVRSTVGSYWPYATTLYDYTRRAMPFDFPGTLTDEEVYSLVGVMLYFNDLLPEDAIVDSATVVDTHMPARDRFVRDDRTGGTQIR